MQQKIYISLLLVLLVVWPVQGQETFSFSQWDRYKLTHNIAYAGYVDYLTAGFAHRSQWVGVNNAPHNEILEIQTPLVNLHNAVGFSYHLNSLPGRSVSHNVLFGYSYIIEMEKIKTAFGLGVGLTARVRKPYDVRDPDVLFPDQKQSFTTPQASFGVVFYNNKFHAGVSIPEFFGYNYSSSGPASDFMMFNELTYKISGGYNYALETSFLNDLQLSSNALFSYFAGIGNLQLDINTNALINNQIIAGLGFRTVEAVYLNIGYKLNRQFSGVYSYDFNVGIPGKQSLGSHIIGIIYNLNYQVKTGNPRAF